MDREKSYKEYDRLQEEALREALGDELFEWLEREAEKNRHSIVTLKWKENQSIPMKKDIVSP